MALTHSSLACAPGYVSFYVVVVQSQEKVGTGDGPIAQYNMSPGMKALPDFGHCLLVLQKAFSICVLPSCTHVATDGAFFNGMFSELCESVVN